MTPEPTTENRLPAVLLNLDMEPTGESSPPVPVVMIQVKLGAEAIARVSVSPAELGLPEQFDPSSFRYEEPPFAFPARAGDLIGTAVNTMLGPSETLWLHLADPVGFLSLLPLEQMLHRFVGDRLIVRVPNFTLPTPRPAGPVTIAVCASEARAKASFNAVSFLAGLVPALLDVGRPAVIHLFTDVEKYPEIAQIEGFRRLAGDERLIVHDPARAPSPVLPQQDAALEDSGTAVSNPWLQWMLQELRGTTADIVHFATHGYTYGGQSALAVAESPRVNRDLLWARFVGPNQLAACLSRLGAWAVGFSSPAPNFSSMGIRDLFDDMARLRPGPVLHHDARSDASVSELVRAYRRLLGAGQTERFVSVDMYAHPSLLDLPSQLLGPESFAGELVHSYLGASAPAAPAPAWVTSTWRYLEQSVARMFPEQGKPVSPAQAAAGKGVEQALRLAGRLIGTSGNPS